MSLYVHRRTAMDKLAAYNVPELKSFLREHNLPVSGTKNDLLARLRTTNVASWLPRHEAMTRVEAGLARPESGHRSGYRSGPAVVEPASTRIRITSNVEIPPTVRREPRPRSSVTVDIPQSVRRERTGSRSHATTADPDIVDKELELLRREKAVLKAELRLARSNKRKAANRRTSRQAPYPETFSPPRDSFAESRDFKDIESMDFCPTPSAKPSHYRHGGGKSSSFDGHSNWMKFPPTF